MIELQAQFLDYAIKTIKLDNVGEFTSHAFTNYHISIGINDEHHFAHTHTQDGLTKSLIKCLQLIAQPLLMKTKLPTFAWGHALCKLGSYSTNRLP